MYLVNNMVNYDVGCGFELNENIIKRSVRDCNEILKLPTGKYYSKLDETIMSGIVSAILVSTIQENTASIKNPFTNGHPDIIPKDTRITNLGIYHTGLEIKCTGGSTKGVGTSTGVNSRISILKDIRWNFHHNKVTSILCALWDYNDDNIPFITSIMLSKLNKSHFGDTRGYAHTGSVMKSWLNPKGKELISSNWVIMYDNKQYIDTYSKLLNKNFHIIRDRKLIHFAPDDFVAPDDNNLSYFF